MPHPWAIVLLAVGAMTRALAPGAVFAQAAPPELTRESEIAARQAEKARVAQPYEPGIAEAFIKKVDEHFVSGHMRWYPFYGPAYLGAGVTLGAGYKLQTGDDHSLDMRGAMSLNTSTRIEVEYRRLGLLGRPSVLTARGGWRAGAGQSFFGLGTAPTSVRDRTRFDFREATAGVGLEARPRDGVVVGGGAGFARTDQPTDADAALARRYTPATLPGLGATVNHLQSHGTVAIDWRPAAGYARRGGYYGVTVRRFDDLDGPFSFRHVDYEVVQHVPVLRDAWAISLRGRVETTHAGRGDEVPFFMLPSLGNGSTLRSFASWRFRDKNSLLVSAEWRVIVNAVADLALFYDAGKVTGRRRDLDLTDLKSSYGIGLRLHTPTATPIRIDIARGNEGLRIVFGTSAAF